MKTPLLVYLAWLSSPAFAGMPKIDVESFLTADDGIFVRAAFPVGSAGRAALPSAAVPVHHLPKTSSRQELLEAIDDHVMPAVVQVLLVAPYQIIRQEIMPGMWMQAMVKDGKKHIVGHGSGFILRKEGRIVTNAHVVEGASGPDVEIFIKLHDDPKPNELADTDIPTGIVAVRPTSRDLAFLQLKSDRKDWPEMPLGSRRLRRSNEVIAIGFPRYAGLTPTIGLVAAVEADPGAPEKGALIRHSADLNEGNSGGPLVDMEGHCAGVNVSMRNQTSVGYAIPIADVLEAEKAILQQH